MKLKTGERNVLIPTHEIQDITLMEDMVSDTASAHVKSKADDLGLQRIDNFLKEYQFSESDILPLTKRPKRGYD